MRFFDIVTNGELPNVHERIWEYLAECEGKPVVIDIKNGSKRSHKQNRYYWGVVIPIIKQMFLETGTTATPEEIHYFLKKNVAKMVKTVTLPDGTRRPIIETSTKLDKAEWENYMTQIRVWAAQWGVMIPEPNE